MWDYSEKVKDHFFHPRNAKIVEGANAVGDVGSIVCGDALRLMLKINPDTEVIEDAGFQTFGCGSAIASSSALTEMIKGLKLEDALKITNKDIADYLDGLPPEKMHCSVMGREALDAAAANYRGESYESAHADSPLVCKCFGVDEARIIRAIRENHLTTVQDVTNYTKAGGACGSCHEKIEEIIERTLKEMANDAESSAEKDRSAGAAPAPQAAPEPELSQAERIKAEADREIQALEEQMRRIREESQAKIARVQEEARQRDEKLRQEKEENLRKAREAEINAQDEGPVNEAVPFYGEVVRVINDMKVALAQDGGSVDLVKVTSEKVYVELAGSCVGCMMTDMTLSWIQQQIMEAVGHYVQVINIAAPQALYPEELEE